MCVCIYTFRAHLFFNCVTAAGFLVFLTRCVFLFLSCPCIRDSVPYVCSFLCFPVSQSDCCTDLKLSGFFYAIKSIKLKTSSGAAALSDVSLL